MSLSGVLLVETSVTATASSKLERLHVRDGMREWQNIIVGSRPMILKGVEGSRREALSPAGLRRRCGARPVHVSLASEGQHFHGPQEVVRHESMELCAYLDGLERGAVSGRYLSQIDVMRWLPELYAELPVPPGLPGRKSGQPPIRPFLWLGGGDDRTPLHFDYEHNLVLQVWGSKHVQLVAPELIRRLRPFGIASPASHISRINLSSDPSALDDIPTLEGVLEAGDLLYLPPFWWHAVRSLEASLSLNWWWNTGLTSWLKHPQQALRRGLHEALRRVRRRDRHSSD